MQVEGMAGNGHGSASLDYARWRRRSAVVRQRIAHRLEQRRIWEQRVEQARKALAEALDGLRREDEALDSDVELLLDMPRGTGIGMERHGSCPTPSSVPADMARQAGHEHVSVTDLFPTPPNARWEEVIIRFRDAHSVTIGVRDVYRVFHYSQMGLADGRDGSPSRQWELLTDFATNHGLLHWGSRQASRQQRKRRERLARQLRAFFGIDGDPFELTEGRQGWQARFSVWPEE
jgi:hypothetical protein